MEMNDDQLIGERKSAERAVEGMDEGPLKVAAFQTILAKLLADPSPAAEAEPAPGKASPRPVKQPNTLTGRVLGIKSEGFFKTQRSLGEVREALGSRGWHYPLSSLSGLMQEIGRASCRE